jgi:hypothetical protein
MHIYPRRRIYSDGNGQHEALAYEACIHASFPEDIVVRIMGYAGYPDTKAVPDEIASHIFPADSLETYGNRTPWGWHKIAERYNQLLKATTEENRIKYMGCILHYISDSAAPYHSTEKYSHYGISRD